MKKRLIIPYEENKNSSILIAFSKIRAHSDMRFEEIGIWGELFHNKKDIYYDIPVDKLNLLLSSLDLSGFTYNIIEAPDLG